MNTHDIELPPLPQGEYRLSPDSLAPTLYDEEMMEAYARSAIEADRKHFAELFTDLSRYANGMYEQEYDPYMEGVADGYGYAAEFLLGNRNAAEEIEADRKRGGEPVGYISQEKFEFLKAPDRDKTAGCMAIIDKSASSACAVPLYAAPQPAEPVLDVPAQVGATRFGEGIKWSTVIAAAQRHYEFMRQPEQEHERLKKAEVAIKEVFGSDCPADPVKVPSDAEILDELQSHGALATSNAICAVRALLALYGQRSE